MDASHRPDEYDHPASDVIYTVGNIPGAGCQRDDFELEFSLGCSCARECEGDCPCTRGAPSYVGGRLSRTANSITECNANCACGPLCGNRLVQRGPLACLQVKPAAARSVGLGLFSSRRIATGQFICEYAGEVIGVDEAQRRLEDNKVGGRMNYVLVVSEHIGDKKLTTCIDPAKFGNIGRYANHSCRPNAALVPVRVDIAVPRVCLFALQDIEPTEEITFNYAGDAAASVHNASETPCLCASNSCLGYLPHSNV